MKKFHLKKGLDIPLQGKPEQIIKPGPYISQVALVADDYIGMKSTMLVQVNEQVKLGQKLFEDKKNPGVFFTAPGCGTVKEIKRGPSSVLKPSCATGKQYRTQRENKWHGMHPE